MSNVYPYLALFTLPRDASLKVVNEVKNVLDACTEAQDIALSGNSTAGAVSELLSYVDPELLNFHLTDHSKICKDMLGGDKFTHVWLVFGVKAVETPAAKDVSADYYRQVVDRQADFIVGKITNQVTQVYRNVTRTQGAAANRCLSRVIPHAYGADTFKEIPTWAMHGLQVTKAIIE
ncbi:hypothetical protein 13VO501A_gene0002 [Vibrio phage 13VO501A]|nr:hypothetical protein 13VO501A_gene0002 [Vibrio phage 13VO501A]